MYVKRAFLSISSLSLNSKKGTHLQRMQRMPKGVFYIPQSLSSAEPRQKEGRQATQLRHLPYLFSLLIYIKYKILKKLGWHLAG